MVDISQLADIGTLAVFIGLIVQLVKYVWKNNDANAVAALVIVVGVALALLVALVRGELQAPADVLDRVIGGFIAALLAMGGYEASIDKLKILFREK